MTELDVSVIIPTYNRKSSLRETLLSISHQSYPLHRLEVVVIDDGSTDGTKEVVGGSFPFALNYQYHTNQGDAAARNLGAQIARADILIFLDDDVIIEPDYVNGILQEHLKSQDVIVMGTMRSWVEDHNSPFQSIMAQISNTETESQLTFDQLCSNNMSLKKDVYFKIGMMQSLGFPGSDIWCDVDFAFRAYKLGFTFRRSTTAICYHKDHNLSNRGIYQSRIKTAAYRSTLLFNKNPSLVEHLPMFNDKSPISFRTDPVSLIIRKSIRSLVSWYPVLMLLEGITTTLERILPKTGLLKPLYRWLIGSYIFLGYRQGLRENCS